MERTNVYLDDDTRAAAQFIKDQLAMVSDSAAIRFAVREIAVQRGWKPGGDPPKLSRQRRRARAAEMKERTDAE